MWVELGHFALILAATIALFSGALGIWAGSTHRDALLSSVRMSAQLMALLLMLSFILLAYAFVQDDFSVRYVINQSNSQLPTFYKIAAVWGGHEGSLLLWVLMLGLWTLAVSIWSKHLPYSIQNLVIGVLALLIFGFALFILFTSNPFVRQLPPMADGTDLNPLLQDIGLIFHPPFLYLGYVGFAVAFAFAIAALISGQLDAAWAKFSRPWTILAWVFLTIGIFLGSAWAYYELGWGGWWFWDPVENASFMPWLAGTALIHSLAVAEKRGIFKQWTILLAIATFSLSLLGTFLVRSGVLTSVHAFSTDPSRGMFILMYLMVVVGGALALYSWRVPLLSSRAKFTLFSKETALLLNNIFLVVSCATVLLGTLFPLLMDALGGGKFSVGPPYFTQVLVPIWLPMMVLMAISVHWHWKQNQWQKIRRATYGIVLTGIVLGLPMPLLFGEWRWGVALALSIAWAVVASTVWALHHRVRNTQAGKSYLSTLFNQPKAFVGMHIAHLGVAVFAIGATIVSAYEWERDVVIHPMQTVQVEHYEIRFQNLQGHRGPNYEALIGHFRVSSEGSPFAVLTPEKRQYFSGGEPMTEASIDRGFLRDVYISLGEMHGDNPETSPWLIRVYWKPLMNWVWVGCLLMAWGGWLSLRDRRYRAKVSKKQVQDSSHGAVPATVKTVGSMGKSASVTATMSKVAGNELTSPDEAKSAPLSSKPARDGAVQVKVAGKAPMASKREEELATTKKVEV